MSESIAHSADVPGPGYSPPPLAVDQQGARTAGWQQPELPPSKPACIHFGVLFANLSAHRHAEGHEWVCGCGQVFVVVSDAGHNKRLVKDWRSSSSTSVKEDGG